MTKKTLFALLLAAVLLLSGCSLEMKDSAVDGKQTIIDVNGERINKQDFLSAYNYSLTLEQYYAQILQSFGGDGTVDEASVLQGTVENYISSLVLSQKAAELGFDQFTDAELADLQAQAEEAHASDLESIRTSMFSDSELEGDELTAAVAEYAESNGYTLEYQLESVKSSKISERLKASVTDTVTITDEELQAALDEKIATEKEKYASSPTSYGTSVNAGTTVYYTPEGYRTLRVISLSKSTDTEGEASDASLQIAALYDRLSAGEDFEALSDDVNTYAICADSTTPNAEVVAAAMELTEPLSYTEIVETETASYLVQLIEILPEHTATLEEARATLYDDTLSDKQETAYEQAVQAWTDAADVKTYTDRLDD